MAPDPDGKGDLYADHAGVGAQETGTSYDVLVELDSMDMIKRYVALVMGVSVGPRLAIEPDDEDKLGIVSLANLLPVEQAGIVTLRGKTRSAPTHNLISTTTLQSG